MNFAEVLKSRRTHKLYDGKAVPREKLQSFLELAITAPNHRRNEPWRFIVVDKESLEPFWNKLQPFLPEVIEPERVESKKQGLGKLFSSVGAMIFVTSMKNENAHIEKENYAAVCCAVQNMMLAAEAEGVGSFWSTGLLFRSPLIRETVGYSEDEDFVGAIFLGHPCGKPTPPTYTLKDKVHNWA